MSKHDVALLEDLASYQNLIGAMQYCTIIKPGITFVVDKLCQFLQAPTTYHWVAAKKLLCYLKGTSNYGTTLHKSSHVELTVFSNVIWASRPDNRHNTNAFCVLLGNSPIS